MKHSFIGTIIATVILVIILMLVYGYYRKLLAKQALAKLNGNQPKSVIGLSSLIIIMATLFITGFIIIVSADITVGAYRFSSTCSNTNLVSDSLAICYNGFGKEIYADRKSAIDDYNANNPNDTLNLKTLLNYFDNNRLNDFEEKIVNSMTFHNVVIQTNQKDFIVEDGMQVRILSDSVNQNSRLTVEVTNTSSFDLDVKLMYPVAMFVQNEIVVPIRVDDMELVSRENDAPIYVLQPGETRVIKYYYPEITEPYVYYDVRIQGQNYTFERR